MEYRRPGRAAFDRKSLPVTSPSLEDGSSQKVGSGATDGPSSAGHAWKAVAKLISTVLTFSVLFLLIQRFQHEIPAIAIPRASYSHFARSVVTSFLPVFQVYPPILIINAQGELEITDGSSNATKVFPDKHPTCQQTLVVYSFANSYNAPFVGQITPPSCSFNRVSWNLTVVSAGKQFDRLGIVYLGNTEVSSLSARK